MEIPLFTPSSFLPSFAVLQSLELRNCAQLWPHTQHNQPFRLSPFTGCFFSLIFLKEELDVEQSQCQFQQCCREGLPPQPGRDESRAFSKSELLHLVKSGTFSGSSSDFLSDSSQLVEDHSKFCMGILTTSGLAVSLSEPTARQPTQKTIDNHRGLQPGAGEEPSPGHGCAARGASELPSCGAAAQLTPWLLPSQLPRLFSAADVPAVRGSEASGHCWRN